MVGSQTLGPGSFTHHLASRAHRKAKRRKTIIVGLTLTSMVDMFSLLVIFLLQAFSASPELLVSRGVTLPSAVTGLEIKDAPVLSLTTEGVFLDQKRIGATDELLRHPAPLMDGLEAQRTLWQKTHPGEKFRGEINLQAHKDLPSVIVSQFMAMLPSQAYGSIQLAVIAGGGGS